MILMRIIGHIINASLAICSLCGIPDERCMPRIPERSKWWQREFLIPSFKVFKLFHWNYFILEKSLWQTQSILLPQNWFFRGQFAIVWCWWKYTIENNFKKVYQVCGGGEGYTLTMAIAQALYSFKFRIHHLFVWMYWMQRELFLNFREFHRHVASYRVPLKSNHQVFLQPKYMRKFTRFME